MTVDTFYGNEADGVIVSNSATYATARAGTGTLTVRSGGSFTLQTGQDNTFNCYEAFIAFDTSSIADGATVSQVDLSLYLFSDGSTTDFTCEARVKSWLATVDTGDWVAGASLSGLTRVATLASSGIGATGSYKTFTEDGTNFQTAVNLTGNTELLLCSNRQVAGNQPTQSEWLQFLHSLTAGTTQDPKLVVTYTSNAAPTITAGPIVTYASGTDTRPGNTWGVTFTASDAESTGADALTYYVRTSATFGGGTQVATGTCTSGTSKVVTGLTWDASGLIEGSQTLYLHILDGGGANTASAGTFTLYAINYTAGGTKWIARKVLSRADTNGITIKPAAGTVGPITLINTSGAARYLHLYDATAVVVGTTVPAFTIEIPAGTLRWGSDNGITFSTGICYSLTTGAGDSDTGAVGANEITGVICWY